MHRFLAKDPDTNQLHNCRMKRLTFGIASSPFLATRVLHQMADDYQDKYPEAAAMVKKSFYVDDCLTGANTPEEALQKLQDLCSLVAEGQMVLRKWRSNSTQVLQQIPEKLRETSDLTLCDPAGSLKTLGVHWSTETDAFFVATPELTEEGPVTKRIISSACAKTFDNLGCYSPALIQAKSLLQQHWIAGRAWDDPAPEDVADKFITWRKELKHIRLHAVPRKLTQNNLSPVMSMQLHGFADASETGYGAVVYARILHQDATITVTIVAAKARVAPKKSVTIPRLELLGSLMLSKLLPKIASILQVEEANTYYWIDSQIVLAWIQKDPQQLKTFVQNRVSAIQSATHKSRWNYVRTHQNPADHASRGLSPRQTVQNHLWWEGPPWLMSPPHLWPSSLEQSPISLPQQQHSALPELKVRKMTTAHGVSWHFIPARSPHCGGIWESGIRRMKEELRKTLHHFTPTAAEFNHLLITAEAVLNSRPLLPISLEEADGAQVITPGHFLIGRPIRAHPQDIPPPKDGLRKVRWSLLRAETEQLWKEVAHSLCPVFAVKTKVDQTTTQHLCGRHCPPER